MRNNEQISSETPNQEIKLPKKSSWEEKLLDVFREQPTTQQRVIQQQAEGLLLKKKST